MYPPQHQPGRSWPRANAGPENLKLVAYVVYRPGQDLTASEARHYLRQNLPDYMVPSLFVAVNAVPMIASLARSTCGITGSF